MTEPVVKLSVIELEQLVVTALTELGLSEVDISIVTKILLYAELRGKTQGIIKIAEKSILPTPGFMAMQIEKRSSSIAHISGNGNIGMCVLNKAAETAIECCAESGMALVGTCGTASSTGSIGYYVDQIANAGFIGLVMAGSPKVMALHGSEKPTMGTNPLAVGLPTGSRPIVFDMATSAVTWFEIIMRHREGTELRPGVALDKGGQPTVSPKEALEGALTTFGGVKGSGLALMVECLTGPLMGASIVGDSTDNRGNLVLAINPTLLAGDGFYDRMDELSRRLRESGTNGSLRLPGDRSHDLPNTVTITQSLFESLRNISG